LAFAKKVAELADLPFLVEDPLEYLEKSGEALPGSSFAEVLELLKVEERVREILKAVAEGSPYPPRRGLGPAKEVAAFYASLLACAASGDKLLAKKFALSVAKRASEVLKTSSDELLLAVAKALGVDLEKDEKAGVVLLVKRTARGLVKRKLSYSVGFATYLKLAKRLSGDPAWKLTNQPLAGGRVYLDRRKAVRLLEEKVAQRVEELASKVAERADLSEAPAWLAELVRELAERSRASAARRPEEASEEPSGPLVRQAFPPCILAILSRAEAGENLSHHERFALATFLLRLGAGEDEVLSVFAKLPDFKERVARYQVEHLAGKRGGGKKYLPYGCAKMKTLGLCNSECGTRTPLEAYRKALKKLRGR